MGYLTQAVAKQLVEGHGPFTYMPEDGFQVDLGAIMSESFVRSDLTIVRKVDFRSNRPDVAVRFSMFNLALVSLLLFVAAGWH